MLPLLVLASAAASGADAFGKYVQPHHYQKVPLGPSQDRSEAAAVNVAAVTAEQAAGNGKQGGGSGVAMTIETEVIAAVLLASLFGSFMLTYLVVLKCYWRCRQRADKSDPAEMSDCVVDGEAGGADDDDEDDDDEAASFCTLCTNIRGSLEPVEIDRHTLMEMLSESSGHAKLDS